MDELTDTFDNIKLCIEKTLPIDRSSKSSGLSYAAFMTRYIWNTEDQLKMKDKATKTHLKGPHKGQSYHSLRVAFMGSPPDTFPLNDALTCAHGNTFCLSQHRLKGAARVLHHILQFFLYACRAGRSAVQTLCAKSVAR